MMRVAFLVATCSLVAACAEGEQNTSGIKSDQQFFVGTGKQPPYMAAGWKPGERGAWEQHLKTRTEAGQNEYAKIR